MELRCSIFVVACPVEYDLGLEEGALKVRRAVLKEILVSEGRAVRQIEWVGRGWEVDVSEDDTARLDGTRTHHDDD